MITCITCGENKTEDEFYKFKSECKTSKKCKYCHEEYNRQAYSRIRDINKAKRIDRNKNVKGYIYFILDKYSGMIKIGMTINLKSRLGDYRTHNPSCELLHSYECINPINEEFRLHDKFSDKRVALEWFKIEKDDIINEKYYT